MKEIKILHVIPNLLKGGAQRIAIDICSELGHRNDLEVRLIYFEGNNEFSFLTQNIDVQKCPAEVVPSISGQSKINIENYEHLVDEYKPNVIHSHLYHAELVTRENPRRNVRYFTHCHSNMRQFQPFGIGTLGSKQKLTECYERKILIPKYEDSNTTFLTISEDTHAYFRSVLPRLFQDNIILLPNAININTFRAVDKNRVEERNLDNSVKLINVGNLLEHKNQIFLLDIMEKLKEKGAEAHLKIIGDGIERNKLEEAIGKRELVKEIQMMGAQDNVTDFLAESHIYVHTALREPFGLVLVEAMAAGLPVVALDGKGNRDIIQDGKNGYIISQQRPELFAEKIIHLSKNQKDYSQMSSFAAQYAKEHFDIGDYGDKLLLIYKKALSR